jgi:hypothetical protein
VISSGIGASILWGWGFDAIPAIMIKLWIVSAVASVLCYFGAVYGFFEAMAIFTVMFCSMTFTASVVFFLAYLTHHNKGDEISVVSAWLAVWYTAEILTFLCMELFRNSVLSLAYLGVMTVISAFIALNRQWLCTT